MFYMNVYVCRSRKGGKGKVRGEVEIPTLYITCDIYIILLVQYMVCVLYFYLLYTC